MIDKDCSKRPGINAFNVNPSVHASGDSSVNEGDFEDITNFWYYKKKVNIIPVESYTKRALVKWENYQNNRIPEPLFEEWKQSGLFNKGVAVILGKTYDDSQTLYLVGIDCDSREAIEKFVNINGKSIPINILSNRLLVEMHKDNPNKIHVYFFSPIPFPNKGPNELNLEIKGQDGKGYMITYPSIHSGGNRYDILGIRDPPILSLNQAMQMLHHLDDIFKNGGLGYLQNFTNNDSLGPILKRAIQNLEFNGELDGFIINEGNRHSLLISIADSILFRHLKQESDENDLERLKAFFIQINETSCSPSPLSQNEVNSIWKSALTYVRSHKEYTADIKTKVYSKGKKDIDTREIIENTTEEILSKYHFATFEESKIIFYYNDGAYVPGGETIIEKEAEKICGFSLSNKHLSEIKGHITRRSFCKRESFDADLDIINLKNGLYHFRKNELLPHDPHYLSLNQKPILYNPKLKPNLFLRFLKDILYPVEINTALELMAYTFYRDCPFEYFFKLFGHGSNGKSVFTELLTGLHGTRSVSNVPITALTENRFALADLEFKDVNIDTELSNVPIKDTSLLKKLTGGRRQQVRLERKNQHAYDGYLHAKLIFNTNTINETIDQTPAYYRREVIISFPNTFSEKDGKFDPLLAQKLTSDEELSGIFNVLMMALRRILKRNGIYLNEKTAEERRAKVERALDSTKAFLSEAISDDPTESDWITKEKLYRAYEKYCHRHKIAYKHIIAFGKEMKNNGCKESRKTVGNDRPNCWIGIKLRPEYEVKEEIQTKLPFSSSEASEVS
jgi:P4 family phage/plasmid primase-like protien